MKARGRGWPLSLICKLAPVVSLVVLPACRSDSGGITSPSRTPQAVSVSPSASISAARVVGDLESLPASPTHVPDSVVIAVGVFPLSMRYAGEQNVAGQEQTTMTVTRFGEGHPAFSPTVLLGSPMQRILAVVENGTPVLHNFSTVDERVDRDVATSKSITIMLTFPQTGYLFFFCKYHLQDSQVGFLETRP
jgi:hypothetical protein